jgi:hypothetical protein
MSAPVDIHELFAENLQVEGDWLRHRAADASHSSLLRVSTFGGIAIAALCIIYFAAEFLR